MKFPVLNTPTNSLSPRRSSFQGHPEIYLASLWCIANIIHLYILFSPTDRRQTVGVHFINKSAYKRISIIFKVKLCSFYGNFMFGLIEKIELIFGRRFIQRLPRGPFSRTTPIIQLSSSTVVYELVVNNARNRNVVQNRCNLESLPISGKNKKQTCIAIKLAAITRINLHTTR